MTINHGTPPVKLNDHQLLREHEDIKEYPLEVIAGKMEKDFFYRKQWYLFIRYMALHNECLRRGFTVLNYTYLWLKVPRELFDFNTSYNTPSEINWDLQRDQPSVL